MAHFIISYDLHHERHYQPVWNLLESWGAVRLLAIPLGRDAQQYCRPGA